MTDIDRFKLLYRRALYDQDVSAEQEVQSILSRAAKAAADDQATYAREMAAVRSQFHLDQQAERARLARDMLARCSSLSDIDFDGDVDESERRRAAAAASSFARNRRSSGALIAKRHDDLRRFVEKYHHQRSPSARAGTLPFFKSLYAVLCLQADEHASRDVEARCLDWTVDLAVFTEAGSGDWLRDSISLLIETLGFTVRSLGYQSNDEIIHNDGSKRAQQDASEPYVLTTAEWLTTTEIVTSLLPCFPRSAITAIRRPSLLGLVFGWRVQRQWPVKVGHGLIERSSITRTKGYKGTLSDRLYMYIYVLVTFWKP